MSGKQVFHKEVVDEFLGHVFIRGDLLEDDVALLLEIAELGIAENIPEDFCGRGELRIEGLGIQARIIARSIGIEMPPAGLDGLHQLMGRAR